MFRIEVFAPQYPIIPPFRDIEAHPVLENPGNHSSQPWRETPSK
jgi:hypothetical protein